MSKGKAFIAMPFREKYDEILKVIQKAVTSLDLEISKLDEMAFTGSIVERMRTEISESDLMIAIVTEENGNVYYEIGIAHCQNIPVVLLTNDSNSLKFDLKDHRAIIYDKVNPNNNFDELLKMLRVTLDTNFAYPHDYFANIFGRHPKEATELGKRKVVESLKEFSNLQEPINIVDWQTLPNGELAVTVKDYMETSVRGIFDRNFYLKRKKID